MSEDWNVHCVDCKSTHDFSDANHQDELMAALCEHAAAIAGLVELLADRRVDIEFRTSWGNIDARWFRDHLGHKLVPISEYGHLLTQCTKYVACAGGCGSSGRCKLDLGHEGDHSTKRAA